MKRTLAAALTAAVFMTLLAGMASAEVAVGDESVAVRTQDSDQVHDFSIRRLLIKCYRIVHSDDADPVTKRRCAKILKRWCNSHPDSRVCRRPVPPPCDRLTDVRITDQITDVRCHHVPPRPCFIAARVTDQLTDVQLNDRCVPIDRPTDEPTDRPSDRPTDKPSDRPTDKPIDPPTRPVEDGIRDGSTDRLKDAAANDAYVGADSADL